jgi:hypothetical protein
VQATTKIVEAGFLIVEADFSASDFNSHNYNNFQPNPKKQPKPKNQPKTQSTTEVAQQQQQQQLLQTKTEKKN